MSNRIKLIVIYIALTAWVGLRADYYVAQNGQKPEHPYTSWASAASNIQDVVDVATNRSMIWVDTGTYRFPADGISSSVVLITKALTLRGIHGAENTMIDGDGLYRCVRLGLPADACAAGPVIIDGFTLTNGFADAGNYYPRGGGIYMFGSSTGTGIVQNCIVSGNTVKKNTDDKHAGGGGIYAYTANFVPVISNCLVAGNSTVDDLERTSGGGLWFRDCNALIVDCVFRDNEASYCGGAMYFVKTQTIVDRCTIISNKAPVSYGGGIYASGNNNEFRNSLVAHNSASVCGGVCSSEELQMYNCTVVSNLNGGVRARKDFTGGMMNNCIIDDDITIEVDGTVTGYNNCLPSIPDKGTWNNTLVTGNNPAMIRFVDAANGNYRLASGSPCINAGVNQPDWLADALDLDGEARIDRFSNQVDIGCYEYQPAGTFIMLQ